MYKDLQEIVISNTYTKRDFYHRLGRLSECLEKVFFSELSGNEDSEKLLFCIEYARKLNDPDFASVLQEWGVGVFKGMSANNLYKRLEEAGAVYETLPELYLYVPVPLSDQLIREVGVWCRQEIGERLMIDLSIDERVVGGCALVWNDTYYDLSLRTRFGEQSGLVSKLIKAYE